MDGQPAAGSPLTAPIGTALPAYDAGSNWRHATAIAGALLIEVLVTGLFLVKLPEKNPIVESSIPIEIVPEAALKPKPKVEPKPLPPRPSEIVPPPEPQKIRESGGSPDLTPGHSGKAARTRAAAVPKPKPAAAPPAKPLPALDLSLPNLAAALSMPSPPRPPPLPPQTEQAMIPAPGPDTPLPESPNASPSIGEGGGDRYLNAVRDNIISHLSYPASVRLMHLAGTAKYEIVIDRQGSLLGVRVLQSTGSEILDRAGIRTIQDAAPFGPPPRDLSGDRIGLVLTLDMEPLSF